MKLISESHVDHGLSQRQLSLVLERFGDHRAFFASTFELPPGYGDAPCALVGPAAGDAAVADADAYIARRGDRRWLSRCVARPELPRTRMITVIGGPHGDEPCVLYTVYGGPQAPREPGDLELELRSAAADRVAGLRAKLAESIAFWAVHALAVVD